MARRDASSGPLRIQGTSCGYEQHAFTDLCSGDTPFQVSSSPTTIYYVSLHSPLLGGGSKLRITSLSPITGKKLDSYMLSSEGEVYTKDNILFAGANTAAPILAWTDKTHKVLKVNVIGTKGVSSFNTPSSEFVESITLHAPKKVNSLPHFLVEYQTATGHSAEVYHIDLKKGAVSQAYKLPLFKGKGTFATSTSDANVYFTRITAEEVTVVSSVSHGVLGRWSVTGSPALAGAYPVHGVSEVVVKGTSASAVRSAVLFSNGQWALVRNNEIAWSRPEFLSGTVAAVWAQLPEEESLALQLEEEHHQDIISAYIHRVNRHLRDLDHVPAWLQSLPNRVLGSVAGKTDESTIGEIQHDTFGFHKLVISATDTGYLSALDVGSKGKIVWSINLRQFMPTTTYFRPSLKAFRGFVEIQDAGATKPLFINSTTGEQVSPEYVHDQSPLALGEDTLITYKLSEGQLKGFLGVEASSQPVWTFVPSAGERIVGFTPRPAKDPVASIGKVLGDRRVLYKYLNPNLVLITAVAEAGHRASFYLLDSVSGQLLHTASHYGVDISRPIPSTLSEHWFTYSFTLDSTSSSPSHGYQLVVSELYESPLPDDRGPLGASVNSSTMQPMGDPVKPHVLSQSFQIPEEISHMAVTQTRQGITSRELLVTLPASNSIIGIPRGVIDPRRPVGRDPTTQEQSEGLVRYAPMIMFDPKWHLSHKYELIGIKDVIASESGVESTSLVFAFGLDIFGTRVAPSFAFDVLGKGFNKVQMLLTVAALFVGVLFVAPLVSNVQIDRREVQALITFRSGESRSTLCGQCHSECAQQLQPASTLATTGLLDACVGGLHVVQHSTNMFPRRGSSLPGRLQAVYVRGAAEYSSSGL